jgi:threonine aldolase
MLETVLEASTGDDVLGEDPTVQKLQAVVAEMCDKEAGVRNRL